MQKKLKLISWNVNGIRACAKKGFMEWLSASLPDICCLQEIKAHPSQLNEELKAPEGYTSFWHPAERKGYSGTAVYIKKAIQSIKFIKNTGAEEFDSEGRILGLEWGPLLLLNCYFPNSRHDHTRLDYKLAFNSHLHEYANSAINNGKKVIVCGDFNVAHKEIDLKNPKENENNPGFLPEERAWMDNFINSGFTDTFRHFYPAREDAYSWWSYRFNSRARNIGWRIDYFCISNNALPGLKGASILDKVQGSDHCPIQMEFAQS